MFSDLRPNEDVADARWAELRPRVVELLEAINAQVFDGEWRIIDKPDSLFILRQWPGLSKHRVGLHKGIHSFIYVCLDNDLASVRIYSRIGDFCWFRRGIKPKHFENVFRAVVKQLLQYMG